jgi:hypothetical protein
LDVVGKRRGRSTLTAAGTWTRTVVLDPAGLQPLLGTAADGTVTAVWWRHDGQRILTRMKPFGRAWTAARRLGTGTWRDAVLDVAPDGSAALLTSDSTTVGANRPTGCRPGDIRLRTRLHARRGPSWSGGRTIHAYCARQPRAVGDVAAGADGRVLVAVTSSRGTYTLTRTGAARPFTTKRRVGPPAASMDLAIGHDNVATIAFATSGGLVTKTQQPRQASWSPRRVLAQGRRVMSVDLATGAGGTTLVGWRDGRPSGSQDIFVARKDTGAAPWHHGELLGDAGASAEAEGWLYPGPGPGAVASWLSTTGDILASTQSSPAPSAARPDAAPRH